ncbi:MAG TPA: hypothetical protein VHC70_00495, partial [Phycisphaerales bacterium]|nr:hypothetical protein [Phycisphaerales bacterium]
MSLQRHRTMVALALMPIASTVQAQGPCDLRWIPVGSVPGTNNVVNASTVWDSDGAAPRGPLVVIGGDFTMAGNVAALRIATYDPATAQWSPLGSGLNGGSVRALAALPNGDLVAGGYFN